MNQGLRGSARVRARLGAAALSVALVLPIVPATVAAGDGLFHPYRVVPVPSEPDAVAIADVTGDTRADVIVTTGYDGDPNADFRLLVLAQRDDGTLAAPVVYATAGTYSARPTSVAVGDTNGDGRDDVVVGLDRFGIQHFPQLADGSLGTPTLVHSTDSTRVRVGQFDGGGRDQVAGIGWGSGTVTIFADTGAGLGATRTYPAQHGGWDDLEVGDVSGDGRDDVVVMSGQGWVPNISVLTQGLNGVLGPAAEYSVAPNTLTKGIGLGDVTGDGRNDVVASYGGNSPGAAVAVFAQTSAGTLAGPVSYTSYDLPEPIDVADVDLDGRADAVTLHGGWQNAGVFRGRADGTLAAEELHAMPYASHYNSHGLAVGDVTGDGWPDVVAADYNHGLVVLDNSAVVQPSVPGAPALTSAAAGDGRVALSWTAPSTDGGSAITGYTATASPGGGTCTTTGLGCSIAGLANGTTYSFAVTASNAVGSGPVSNTVTATPGVPPFAPPSLTTSPNLATGVGLTWQAPINPGTSVVSGYRIYRSTVAGGTPSLLAHVGNVLSYTDTAVVNGGQYAYRVAAVSSFGEGAPSAEARAQRGTAPSAPQTPTASAGGAGITVKWSAPASNGGASVTAYRIYRASTSGAGGALLATVGPTTTSYLDKAIVKKTRYVYSVSAVNVLGEGARSSEAWATAR